MDTDDRKLFETSLRRLAEQRSGADLDAGLDDIGWRDALADDAAAAASILFAVQGELAACSSALDDLLSTALGLAANATTAVVLPTASDRPPGTITDGRLVVRGVGTHRTRTAETVIVVADNGSAEYVVALPASDLTLRPAAGLDPDGGWVVVHADLDSVPRDATATAAWPAALAAGQFALATELVALSRAMLGLARDHAVERVQFGHPIASFQAVRHRLADALFAVEAADGAVSVGWSESTPFAAAMAKAIAGRSAKTVARHSQQVLAGMGFTSEHRFHHYLRRALVLDGLLGSSTSLSEALGAQVLATSTVPPMLAL